MFRFASFREMRPRREHVSKRGEKREGREKGEEERRRKSTNFFFILRNS